jgi:hypothetical protein
MFGDAERNIGNTCTLDCNCIVESIFIISNFSLLLILTGKGYMTGSSKCKNTQRWRVSPKTCRWWKRHAGKGRGGARPARPFDTDMPKHQAMALFLLAEVIIDLVTGMPGFRICSRAAPCKLQRVTFSYNARDMRKQEKTGTSPAQALDCGFYRGA